LAARRRWNEECSFPSGGAALAATAVGQVAVERSHVVNPNSRAKSQHRHYALERERRKVDGVILKPETFDAQGHRPSGRREPEEAADL